MEQDFAAVAAATLANKHLTLERITEKAYEVARKEAARIEGFGYRRTWQETIPSGKAGYVAMVEWVIRNAGVAAPCSASLASPALKHQSESYPPRYRGRVPWKIKMACTVRPDLEFLVEKFLGKKHGTVAVMDEVYECWVNMHGAVAAICRNGEKLGIKPAEFDVVEWHVQTPNDAKAMPNARV